MKRAATRRERTLKHQLDEAMAINHSAASALVVVRAERDRARVELGSAQIEIAELKQQAETLKEANDHLAGVNMGESERHQKHQRQLFRMIFDLNLKLANRAGYIERVRENEPRFTAEPASDASIDDIRQQLASAESENQRDRIIESISTRTLNDVLGGPDDPFLQP